MWKLVMKCDFGSCANQYHIMADSFPQTLCISPQPSLFFKRCKRVSLLDMTPASQMDGEHASSPQVRLRGPICQLTDEPLSWLLPLFFPFLRCVASSKSHRIHADTPGNVFEAHTYISDMRKQLGGITGFGLANENETL